MRNVVSLFRSFEKEILFLGFLASAITTMKFVFMIFIYYQLFVGTAAPGNAPVATGYGEAYEKIFFYALMAAIAALWTLATNVLELKRKKLSGVIVLVNVVCLFVFAIDFIYICLADMNGNHDPNVFPIAQILVSPCIVGVIGAAILPVIWLSRRHIKNDTAAA